MSLLLVFLALIIVLLTYDIYRRYTSPYPGIKKVHFSWPKIIQMFIFYFSQKKSSGRLVASYREKYGDIFILPILGDDYVVIAGEEAVTWISKNEREDNFERVFISNVRQLLSNTNYKEESANKDIWKHNRSHLSAALMQSTVIDKFCPTMVEVMDKHLSQTKVIDDVLLATLTFEVGWLFIVGKRGIEYRKQVHQHYKDIRAGLFAMPFNLPGTKLRKALQARAKIAEVIYKIVEDDPTARDDPDCSLSVILDPKEMKSIQPELRILGLLFAATDTTNSSTSGLLWHLIENPEILKKLQKEIRENPEPHSLGDLQKFTYLNKCVREALRLYGVDAVVRKSKVPLKYKNIQFPAGTLFSIITGYDHLNVANPQIFNPDREEKFKLEPFGTPARNCLGKVFAQFQMKILLYHILKNYDVVGEKDEGASVRQGFSVRLNKARLRLEPCSTN